MTILQLVPNAKIMNRNDLQEKYPPRGGYLQDGISVLINTRWKDVSFC
jgi:hypothetical protein